MANNWEQSNTTTSTHHSTNTNISDSKNTKELPTPPAASAGLKNNNAQMGMAKSTNTQPSRLQNTLDSLPVYNYQMESSWTNTTTPTKLSYEINQGNPLDLQKKTPNKRRRSPEELEQEMLRKKTRI